MKRNIMIMTVLTLVFLLTSVLIQGTSCRDQQEAGLPPEASGGGQPVQAVAPQASEGAAAPSSSVTFLTSVRFYVKMVIDKEYGLLAHLGGKRDSEVHRTTDSPDNRWWDNPLVVYEEASLSRDPDLTAGFDGEVIAGQGESANVTVAITMVPHADIAIATLPKCDAMKGKITVRITAASDFYDGRWTELVRVDDKAMVFSFDTCDPSRRLEVIGSETRTVSAFSFERYTRDQDRWEPRDAWPTQPESGDSWITIYGKDGVIDVTAYQYVE